MAPRTYSEGEDIKCGNVGGTLEANERSMRRSSRLSFGHTNFRMSRWQKTAHIDGDGVLPRYPYYMMYGEQVDQLATLVVATSCRHTLRESIIIYSLVSIMYII